MILGLNESNSGELVTDKDVSGYDPHAMPCTCSGRRRS